MQLTIEQTQSAAARLGKLTTYGHFIGGEWVESDSGQTIALENPATRQTLAHIQSGNPVDIDRAVQAAAAAFPKWSRTSAAERQRILIAIAQKLRDRLLDYAVLESLNNGKPVLEACYVDVPSAISQFEYFAGTGFHLNGETIDFNDATVLVHREPIGVAAQIIPWNVPLIMAAMKLAPALAAGCTVVLKPAETVCLSVMELVKDIATIVPPGVVNVVTGYGSSVGDALVTHPKVRKVAFTGSRATAQRIIANAGKNIIPQSMELGGKSANIVCEDADIEAAAQSAVLSTVLNKGEVCVAGTRVFVHSKVEDRFLDAFTRALATVQIGDPLDPRTRLGAMASQGQFDKVNSYIAIGRDEGAKVSYGGKAASPASCPGGLFIEPTIFTNVSNAMRIAQDEIFGPVTAVIRWTDEAQMLKEVNDVDFGLAGGIWTNDLRRAHRISRAMETGIVWVNRYYNYKDGMPVGGYKQSGFGRENCLETLNHYTHTKSVVINLSEGSGHH